MEKEKQKDETKGFKGFFTRRLPNFVHTWVNFPLLLVLAGAVIILFVQDNDITKIYSNNETINELKREIKLNNDSVDYYKQKINELFTDREELERISREQYHMKRAHEDVFITDIP